MELIFNKIIIMNNLEIFYTFLGFMLLCIIISFILVLKELKKQNADK